MSTYTGIPLLTLSGVRDSISQAVADGATTEVAASCYYDKLKDILQYNPSWVMMPSFLKDGKAYTMISGLSGSLNVTRTTTPTASRATRVNASGFIETVTDNVLRLDYPIGGGCPAALIEPSGQNLVQRSEEFNNNFHFPFNLNAFGSGSVANTTATLDPYGTNVADYIQENSAAGVAHSIIDIFSGNVSGTTYTWSVFAKAAERTIINLFNNGGGGGSANFNLTTGVATGTGGSMQNYGNGWYRCILTYNSTATGNHNVQIRLCDASGNTTYNGTGNQGAYIFGAQLEAGSVATTYIPTTTAAVSRAADVISASGALVSGLIGQTEGTMYWEGAISRIDRVIFSLAQGTSVTNFIYLQTLSNGFFRADVFANNSSTCAIQSLATATLGQFYKIAFAYKENDFALYINGVLQGSDNLGALPSGLSNAIFARGDSSLITDQRCRAAAIYTTRLTNDQLANLTRLT